MRSIAILDAPSNLGLRPPTVTSVPGCAKAPGALRDHGLVARLHARDAGCLTPPRYDPGDWRPGDGVCHATEIATYSRRLADRIGAIIDAGEFPVVLGGDCSILLGSGLAMHRLGESVGGRIGLVFVDGHSDFRHPGNASYVGAAAGEDLALVTGRGQADLAAIESRRPYFRDVDVVVMGIRAQDEYRLDLQAAGIVTRPVPTLRVEGAARSAQWARDQLVDCAGYWVHVDVDVLDPAVMPAVDAPDPGGIAFPELELLLAGLVDTPHCLGVEITVFDPDYDPDGVYAEEITSAIVAGLTPARTVAARPDLAAARNDLATGRRPVAPELSPGAPELSPADAELSPVDPEPSPVDPEPSPADPEPSPADAEPALSADAEPAPSSADRGSTLPGPGFESVPLSAPPSPAPVPAAPEPTPPTARLASAPPPDWLASRLSSGGLRPASGGLRPSSGGLRPGGLRPRRSAADPDPTSSATLPESTLLAATPPSADPAKPSPAVPASSRASEPEPASPAADPAEAPDDAIARMDAVSEQPSTEPDDTVEETTAATDTEPEPVTVAWPDTEPEPTSAARPDTEPTPAPWSDTEPEPISAAWSDTEPERVSASWSDAEPGAASDQDETSADDESAAPTPTEANIPAGTRPLGSAPLLDSDPLPATRPGMLRPRNTESFSLPAQRTAPGPGEPADIA